MAVLAVWYFFSDVQTKKFNIQEDQENIGGEEISQEEYANKLEFDTHLKVYISEIQILLEEYHSQYGVFPKDYVPLTKNNPFPTTDVAELEKAIQYTALQENTHYEIRARFKISTRTVIFSPTISALRYQVKTGNFIGN
ncbi:MAG: hypothetical protein A3J55_00480 [Candidatus Ryanbacteria bacterium RIFCSPHIGHO2_02_FULL_45_17b]|uniref:Uncharacterized protein n=1 Tax=Candidatus Ryanbacteria bacterium RIFCSPHIGHO2_01_FULL_45_22 TaxID=1802114 RepID=A0A1G2G0P2_9BACT|nr:MAG: hypothetical protein A2719_02945 [Candidatus Ryanbacteria bacterium RIFCSPHIGHO2_01_FULL_45_22]OGZ47018.1 MAG: hypothetical protein A3J55_00480 [Candidatus Ryanbacteria bacterium RIFCSPHIGHO2_02_FULL_45_17b]